MEFLRRSFGRLVAAAVLAASLSLVPAGPASAYKRAPRCIDAHVHKSLYTYVHVLNKCPVDLRIKVIVKRHPDSRCHWTRARKGSYAYLMALTGSFDRVVVC